MNSPDRQAAIPNLGVDSPDQAETDSAGAERYHVGFAAAWQQMSEGQAWATSCIATERMKTEKRRGMPCVPFHAEAHCLHRGGSGKMSPQLSFIIPALNEEKLLGPVLSNISDTLDESLLYEVIVVDHDSMDNTVRVAEQGGARVTSVSGGTIASLRNVGARMATGNVLVFLDADVMLSKAWANNIRGVIDCLNDNPRLVTGSWVGVTNDHRLLNRFWYHPLTRRENTHINSGHMIVTKPFFDELGGFDDSRETGEDYDFSMRALRAGGQIKDDQDLPVVHLGYPTDWKSFFRRELWHGLGDYASLRTFLASKVAILATLFLAAHIGLLVTLVWLNPVYSMVSATMIVAICLCSSFVKYRTNGVVVVGVNTVIYYLYFWARAAALVAAVAGVDTGRARPLSRSINDS
jgi:glycosyltransferase involved in cell wall biosynthesis